MNAPKKQTLNIVIEGPGNTGKVAMALLTIDMLEKHGVVVARQGFDAPAPKVIGMDLDVASRIVREVSDRVQVVIDTKNNPRPGPAKVIVPTIVFAVKQLGQSGNWQWLATSQEDLQLVIASGLVKTKDRALKAIKNCLTLFGATAQIAIEIENYKRAKVRYEFPAKLAIDAPRLVLGALPKS